MEWRRQMLAAGMKGHALEELESHLCEEVESLIREGRGASEAFETAVHRLGGRELLAAEFAKTTGDGRDRRLKLMVLGLTGIAYLAPLLLSAAKTVECHESNGTIAWPVSGHIHGGVDV
jgi:hypothetical protein